MSCCSASVGNQEHRQWAEMIGTDNQSKKGWGKPTGFPSKQALRYMVENNPEEEELQEVKSEVSGRENIKPKAYYRKSVSSHQTGKCKKQD